MDASPTGYLSRVPGFFAFAGNRSVLMILGGLSLITAPLYWAMSTGAGSIIPMVDIWGRVITFGLETTIYFHFISITASGTKDINPPDFTDRNTIIGAIGRYLAALVPMGIGLVLLALDTSMDDALHMTTAPDLDILLAHPAAMAVIALGVLLLPLLTIIAAMSGTMGAVLNPVVWLHSLRVAGSAYLPAVALYYVVFFTELLLWNPMLLAARESLYVPVITLVATIFLSYLPMTLRARLLGALAEPHFQEIE